jgi:glycosyltransferase 2 family protein
MVNIVAARSSKLKYRFLFGAKIAFACAIIWYIVSKIDVRLLAAAVRSVHPWFLALTLLQLLAVVVLGAVRWGFIQTAIEHPLPRRLLVELYWIGMMFSQVLPSASGGDAVRGWLTWRAGVPLRAAIHGILLERVVLVLSLVWFVAPFAPRFAERLGLTIGVWGPVQLVAAALAGFVILLSADSLLPLVRVRLKLVDALMDLSHDSRRAFLSPAGAVVALTCFATHLNLVIAAWWLASAMDLPIELIDLMALIPIVNLLSTLPISIGGWGVREGLMVALLGKLGIAGADALAFSILFGLAQLAVSLLGLPMWLTLRPSAKELEEIL